MYIRNVRRRHLQRSTQTSATFGADIRNVRRRHLQRSAQTHATFGADTRTERRAQWKEL
ncbi:hypothetical protein [Leyella stercorea]|uniref:hypothetical protein n=1 Tax=Leyella stercorea TaxID=363265 RepID=UPI003A91A115